MLPLLYPSNTTTSGFFQNNGLGFFNRCTKCEITEERNGIYEIEINILTSDRLAKSVVCGMFVKVKPNPFDDPQIFEIYAISADLNKIKISGQHIHYLLNTTVTFEPTARQTGTPSQIWDRIVNAGWWTPENIFTFTTDITTSATIYPGYVSEYDNRNVSATELLGGIDGSMLDIFGGELYYNNFTVSLLSHRGTDTGIALRYGSNLSSKTQESNNQTIYSQIMPYARVKAHDEGTKQDSDYFVYLENAIAIPNSPLTYEKALLYDFTDKMNDFTLSIIQPGYYNNMLEARARLTQEAESYINKYNSALITISTNIEIDVAETLKGLNGCKLCDTVLIDFDDSGTVARTKIIKVVYDALAEKYIKMELGQPKKTIADMITVKNLGGA